MMAQSPDRTRKPPTRRRRGFQQAAILLADRVQKAAEGRGFAMARLLTHWPEIAGAQLARVTRPVRISHARGGFGATPPDPQIIEKADQVARQFQDPILAQAMAQLALNIETKRHRNH